MAQASSRLFDNVGRMMNDAAGVADGVRREVESMVRAQAERFVMDMNLVKREDYDALRELVQTQSAELRALKAEVAALKGTGAADSTPKPLRSPSSLISTATAWLRRRCSTILREKGWTRHSTWGTSSA